VDDQVGSRLGNEARDALAVADVELVVLEALCRLLEPAQVPGRVAVLAEEVAAEVVVDAVDAPVALVEEGDHLGADQPARPRDESGPHAASVDERPAGAAVGMSGKLATWV
jgi:hypothetical protein